VRGAHDTLSFLLVCGIDLSRPRLEDISLYTNSDFRYKSSRPAPLRRGAAHRHVTLGAGCDGREPASGGNTDETLAADGEIVWSWRRDRGVDPARWCGFGNGDNKRRSPGRARISRNTIARGKPGCPGCTCGLTRVLFCSTLRTRDCGRSRRPAFPAPSHQRGTTRWQNPGASVPRGAHACIKLLWKGQGNGGRTRDRTLDLSRVKGTLSR
jgi:hypothetical protein